MGDSGKFYDDYTTNLQDLSYKQLTLSSKLFKIYKGLLKDIHGFLSCVCTLVYILSASPLARVMFYQSLVLCEAVSELYLGISASDGHLV